MRLVGMGGRIWSRIRARRGRWLLGCVGMALLALAIFAAPFWWIQLSTRADVYSRVEDIPAQPVALVLGTSRWLHDGRTNLFFLYRIRTAAALYKSGKVHHLIVSGDNRRKSYNEPLEMLDALQGEGVPKEAVTLDYAGFRTLDSVVRCREVFGQKRFIIVSQDFHNRRAVFIAHYYGIQATGLNAPDVPAVYQVKSLIREYFARFKAILDLYILDTQPRFLGPLELIPVWEGPAPGENAP